MTGNELRARFAAALSDAGQEPSRPASGRLQGQPRWFWEAPAEQRVGTRFRSECLATITAVQDYAGAWTAERGRCHRFVYVEDDGRPANCPEPTVTSGWRRDDQGRWHVVVKGAKMWIVAGSAGGMWRQEEAGGR